MDVAGNCLRAAIILAALLVSGCVSIVEVHSDGAEPKLSIWPLGVKIERGKADAIAVRTTALGAAYGCDTAALGAMSASCILIDQPACGVAVVYPDDKTDMTLLKRIGRETAVRCLNRGDSK